MTDLRDAAFTTIRDIMRADKNALVITVDLGAFVLDEIAKEFPDRVINVGIAEQLAISTAAGMAICGKRPFVYGISMILVRRALSQITMDIGCNCLPVVILGLGAGKSFATDGPSHCGTGDLEIMGTVPNMEVYTPLDAPQMNFYLNAAYARSGPAYVRFDK